MATLAEIHERIKYHRQAAEVDRLHAKRNDVTATALQRHGDGSEHAHSALAAARAMRDAQLRSWHENNAAIRAL